MLLPSKNKLNLRTIAKSWSKEPGTVSKKKILNRLIAAYWRDEFEPDHYDPSYDGGSHREAFVSHVHLRRRANGIVRVNWLEPGSKVS